MPYSSEFTRGYVVGLYQAGLSTSEIAARPEVNFCAKTISRWVKRFESDSLEGLKTRKKSGRKRVTSPAQEQRMAESVAAQPSKAVLQSAREAVPDVEMSTSSVYRRVRSFGLPCQPASVASSWKRRKEARYNFALDNMLRPPEFWKSVVWTSHTIFYWDQDGSLHYRRPSRSETNDEQNTRGQGVKAGFWACAWAHGAIALIRTIPRMTSNEYQRILNCELLPQLKKLFTSDEDITFLYDVANARTERVLKRWLTGHERLTALPSPAVSPDLNLVDCIWEAIAEQWTGPPPESRDIFDRHAKRVWRTFRFRPKTNILSDFAESYPQRLDAVIEAEGSSPDGSESEVSERDLSEPNVSEPVAS